jgi:hypothetical protein
MEQKVKDVAAIDAGALVQACVISNAFRGNYLSKKENTV